YHHRSVVEVSHALVIFLTFLQDKDPHYFAGQHDRLQGVGELVDVEHGHAPELRDFVEIEIVGDDFGFDLPGELDKLVIDLAHVREFSFAYDDLVAALLFLQPLKYVESATPAVTFDRVGAVGDLLELAQHELRNHKRARKKSGLGDIGHTSVYDHRCV